MARGRQYYDPIIQAPSRVESAGTRRIELYPEQDVRDNTVTLRWVARLIGEDGLIADKSPGSFDHDDALRQAHELWPGLEVFELREESEDSTWDGMGPSPRLWQNAVAAAGVTKEQFTSVLHEAANTVEAHQGSSPGDADGASRQTPPQGPLPEGVGASPGPGDDQPQQLHALTAGKTGTYVHLDDVIVCLEYFAAQFDGDNPSAALGIRQAAAALREPF